MKRIISCLLTIALLLGILPVSQTTAQAADRPVWKIAWVHVPETTYKVERLCLGV